MKLYPYNNSWINSLTPITRFGTKRSDIATAQENKSSSEASNNKKRQAAITRTKNTNDLDLLVNSSQSPLLHTKSVFPFDFFPDQLSIEIAQINVVKKNFFFTHHIQSIPIKNVADVFLQTSLLFASLKIIDSSYIENSVKIEYLKKDDACRARRIIQGLVVANKEGIDLNGIPTSSLIQKLEQLGNARDVDIMN